MADRLASYKQNAHFIHRIDNNPRICASVLMELGKQWFSLLSGTFKTKTYAEYVGCSNHVKWLN